MDGRWCSRCRVQISPPLLTGSCVFGSKSSVWVLNFLILKFGNDAKSVVKGNRVPRARGPVLGTEWVFSEWALSLLFFAHANSAPPHTASLVQETVRLWLHSPLSSTHAHSDNLFMAHPPALRHNYAPLI